VTSPRSPATYPIVEKQSPNVNTFLIAILIAISGWTLKEVIDHGKQLARFTERVEGLASRVDDLEKRVRFFRQ
jgi:hypothetical protein